MHASGRTGTVVLIVGWWFLLTALGAGRGGEFTGSPAEAADGRPVGRTNRADATAWKGRPTNQSERPSLPGTRHPVPRESPRLFGSRERLQQLARERADAYRRVVSVAREQEADEWSKLVSLSLVCAIERDATLGRQAIDLAMKTIAGPIRVGHETFGHDLARCAVVYDLCHEHWTADEQSRFYDYMNKTIAANVQSETHVFHNGWYGYKNWGIGLACYATMYENPRAEERLRELERDYLTRAAPALELAGDGGGWAEGYYVNYWLYEWLVFCEAARVCEGVDYYAAAPKFYRQRAVAGMFESYPGIDAYRSRRPVPIGDGGGRLFGGDRDKALAARRILVNYFRDDPDHQAVHAFNETTPRSSVGVYAYKDFLWRDTSVSKADLKTFRLAHVSPGPGYVLARSSWDENATYFFFKVGDRFTAHQHLDVGNFVIYRQAELVGDGGHYDGFGTLHDVNYHLRTIAHNTVLVYDPAEKWPAIRAGQVRGNDGGQSHNWPHHNGAVSDADAWRQSRTLYDIADLVAFEDTGAYVYVAADCTRAYSPAKLESCTRQIVFVRPGTFLIVDRVVACDPRFKKTWLLQAMTRPQGQPPSLIVTHGPGRLFLQTLLPRAAEVRLQDGDNLYRYGGNAYPPQRDTGPAPQCRIEISPATAAREDWFLHVLTATDAGVESVEPASLEDESTEIRVRLGRISFRLHKDRLGGSSEADGQRQPLAATVRM